MDEVILRLGIFGETFTGKTQILKRYFEGTFSSRYEASIKAQIYQKQVTMDDIAISLNIWDTMGPEKYITLYKNYIEGQEGVILVYDKSDKNSFDRLDFWIKLIKENTKNPLITIQIVGNKIDLPEKDIKITTEEGLTYAKKNSLSYMECSAKDNTNINQIFYHFIKETLMKKFDLVPIIQKRKRYLQLISKKIKEDFVKYVPNHKSYGLKSKESNNILVITNNKMFQGCEIVRDRNDEEEDLGYLKYSYDNNKKIKFNFCVFNTEDISKLKKTFIVESLNIDFAFITYNFGEKKNILNEIFFYYSYLNQIFEDIPVFFIEESYEPNGEVAEICRFLKINYIFASFVDAFFISGVLNELLPLKK